MLLPCTLALVAASAASFPDAWGLPFAIVLARGVPRLAWTIVGHNDKQYTVSLFKMTFSDQKFPSHDANRHQASLNDR